MRFVKVLSRLILVVGLLYLSSCGYFTSGDWEDDPANWGRAFHSVKPDDVVVLHSLYWQSPHWTNEFAYFFEIAPNDKLRGQLFTQNALVRLQGSAASEAKQDCGVDCPTWFAPKAIEEYDIWVFEDWPNSNFRVFIDRETGHMFLTDYQF